MAFVWSLITFLNALNFWGTYWQVLPQGLLEYRLLFRRRVVPYSMIQGVSWDDAPRGKRGGNRIRFSIFLDTPLLARPAEYERFVAALEQHLDPMLIHV